MKKKKSVNKRVQSAVLGCSLKNNRMISVYFEGKPFSIRVIQVYAPSTSAEKAEIERKTRCPFHHMGLDAKVGSQEIPEVIGKFDLGVQNEAGQRLTDFAKRMRMPKCAHGS